MVVLSMQAPILATKLYAPPAASDAVDRPRLIERLEQGADRKLTIVCAPAGFGKTTLVREWLAVRASPFAWLSLDEEDGTAPRFVRCVIEALQTVAEGLGARAVEHLERNPLEPVQPALMMLLQDLGELKQDMVLVLEDYHATDAAAVDEALLLLVEHAPRHLHLVVTTREDPRLPLSRLRVRDQLVELRAADLRFSPDEAASFFRDTMRLSLTAEDVTALAKRTEGWIAGLKLAGVSLRDREDASAFVASFAGDNRFVVDYLVEEVLGRQSDEARAFLLRTSILDDMCGPLCDAVTGSEGGGSTLVDLERGNLFVVPLDDTRTWFRYHHLFRDLLRTRIRERYGSEIPELHRRASRWHEAAGRIADAVRHALEGEDFGAVQRLVVEHGPAMRGRYQVATLLEWLGKVPERVFRTHPGLAVESARALMDAGELEASDARLREAEAWLAEGVAHVAEGSTGSDGAGDPDGGRISLPARIATARAYLAQAQEDVAATVRHAEEALRLLPESETFERAVAGSLLGLANWSHGRLEEAYAAFAGGLANMERAGNVLVALSGTYILADIRVEQGRLRDATDLYERALARMAREGEPAMLGAANLHLGLSELAWERGAWDDATRARRRSVELRDTAALPDTGYRWSLGDARMRAATGDLDAALALLDEAEHRFVRTPVPDVRPISAQRVRLWLAAGDLDSAVGWAADSGLLLDGNVRYLQEYALMTLARVHVALEEANGRHSRGALDGTLDLLARLFEASQRGGRTRSAIEIALVQARAQEAVGNATLALAAMEQALALAEPEGFIGLFLDEGDAVAELLVRTGAHGIRPAFVRRISAGFEAARKRLEPERSVVHDAEGAQLEPLTDREIEVLRLIEEGLSNHQICERLHRALSTVKGYNRSIFAKLEVERRTEAVARAREIGLL